MTAPASIPDRVAALNERVDALRPRVDELTLLGVSNELMLAGLADTAPPADGADDVAGPSLRAMGFETITAHRLAAIHHLLDHVAYRLDALDGDAR